MSIARRGLVVAMALAAVLAQRSLLLIVQEPSCQDVIHVVQGTGLGFTLTWESERECVFKLRGDAARIEGVLGGLDAMGLRPGYATMAVE